MCNSYCIFNSVFSNIFISSISSVSTRSSRPEIGLYYKTQSKLEPQFQMMDQAENQRSNRISIIATTRYEELANIFIQLHRTPLPPSKFLWTLLCLPNIHLFLWKALTEGLLTFDSNIFPRCNFDLKIIILLSWCCWLLVYHSICIWWILCTSILIA